MANPPTVIINADDLGYSRQVNDAIFGLMERRRITSATVMANGPAVEDAAARSKQFPHCSFGAHLCLTEFEPVTKPGTALPFVGGNGEFDAGRFERQRPDGQVRKNIYEEWCGQIRRLQSLGVQISHIDSHQHVHTRPWLFPVLKSVQRAFGIRKVRLSLNLYYAPEHGTGFMLRLKKQLFNAALRNYYATRTTDVFTNLRWFKLISAQRPVRANSIELMTHPGGPGYLDETSLLESEWFEDLSKTHRVINYNNL